MISTVALLRRDPEAWEALVVAIAEGEEPAVDDDLASRLLEADSLEAWAQVAGAALDASGRYFTIGGKLKGVRTWLGTHAVEHLGDGRAAWGVRLQLLARNSTNDGGLAEASELVARLDDEDEPEMLGLALIYQARGAFTEHNSGLALTAATRAERILRECGSENHPSALRQLAAANFYAGKVAHALRLYDVAFNFPGQFGAGAVNVFKTVRDPKISAIDEVRDVGMWADERTPEWARAIGVLASAWDVPKEADGLWLKFEFYLNIVLNEGHDGDFEVVVRQAAERDAWPVVDRALRGFLVLFPQDEWARQKLEFFKQSGRI